MTETTILSVEAFSIAFQHRRDPEVRLQAQADLRVEQVQPRLLPNGHSTLSGLPDATCSPAWSHLYEAVRQDLTNSVLLIVP